MIKNIGLSETKAKELLKKYGYNRLEAVKTKTIFDIALEVLKEPMFILLIITAFIYFFISKEIVEGLIMILSVIFMMAIDIIQEYKTDKSLEKLRELSEPKALVKRDGKIIEIDSANVVPGDILIITEGDKICADGVILSQSDLAVDESSLTGESDIIYKNISEDQNNNYFKVNHVYQGTNVVLGSAEIKVTATGQNTETGKIGKSILETPMRPTPLETQVRGLVKSVSFLALLMLVAVFFITYYRYNDLYKAILSGITFAISTIPEEFPVVLTIFLSLGAYRLSTKKSLIRKLSSVETLGGISVLCVDKTGTLTENKMQVSNISCLKPDNQEYLKKIAVLACEKNSYDPMEQAIIKYCNLDTDKLFENKLITEYPFTSELKMMGHVWELNNKPLIAVKGSPESVLKISKLTESQKTQIERQQYDLSKEGYRVIAVAAIELQSESEIPKNIKDCELEFIGLISFVDPPREAVFESIKICNQAGIKVIMITGDNPVTARAIGSKIGLSLDGNILTGDQIESMSDEQLTLAVKNTNIFARVIPEQKMKIIKAIKSNNLVVAMTGDGVNDAPALKFADIGIAMGQRGTNVAKEASDMVLLDDNFSTIVETIKDGRRIRDNISKAIRYVLTFKVPIVLITLLLPFIGLSPMLMPIHIVLLELIVGPISAIVLERQPAEKNIMKKNPIDISKKLISFGDLFKIIFQGLIIFLNTFISYITIIKNNGDENLARSFALSILVFSNIFLVYVNSSDTKSIFEVIKEFSKDKIIWLIVGSVIIFQLLLLYLSPLSFVFKTRALSSSQLISVILISIVSVIWYEFFKLFINFKNKYK
ncbi:MAG: cation-translocating P-type ATPase [Oscillospiraceae bacterium]|nr:cation-translocating P-type ATPase [Oscillospiraceae bacterium]